MAPEGDNHDPVGNTPFGPLDCILAALAIFGCPILGILLGWATFEEGGGMVSIPDLVGRIVGGGFFGLVAGLAIVGLMIFIQRRK